MGVKHPAPYSASVLDVLARIVKEEGASLAVGSNPVRVLDPFAGTGRIHDLHCEGVVHTVGIELEPEWAALHPQTLVGTALDLPFPSGCVDMIVTSPCYGNRMADKYAGDAKGSRRHTYRIDLGRPLSDGSAAVMQWGDGYRYFHERAWREAHRVLRVGGKFVLNISDHIRNDLVQPVSTWHVAKLCELGFLLDSWEAVPTPRQRHGANGEKRMPNEWVFTLTRGF